MVLLSITAVAMSCALLIATDSLFTGFIDAIRNSAGKHLGDIILEAPSNRVITDYTVFLDSLEQAQCIQSATAVLSSQGLLLSAPGRTRAVQVWGIELPRRLSVTPMQQFLLFQKDLPPDQISFSVPDNPDAVGGIAAIGTIASPDSLTDEYDVKAVKEYLGHTMALTIGSVVQSADVNPETETAGQRFSRKVVKFDLVDVLMTGINQFDESFVLLPIGELSSKLYPDSGNAANLVHIRLEPDTDEDMAIAVVNGLWQNFSKDRYDWADFVSIDSAKNIQARLIKEYEKQMGVLLGIFGLVSGGIIILVFCIFYLIVMTRRKDIGILKSCGLSSISVAGLFMLFGMIVGLLGAVAGIGLGYVIILNINGIEHAIALLTGVKLWKAGTYMFSQIPNTMHWGSVLWITAAGVVAAAVGSLIPAVAAARVRPVETLQYE